MQLLIDDSNHEWISFRSSTAVRKHNSLLLMPTQFLVRHLKLIFLSNLISSIFLIASVFSTKEIAISLVLVTCFINALIFFNLPLSTIKDIKLIDVKNVPIQLRMCLYMFIIIGLLAGLNVIRSFIAAPLI